MKIADLVRAFADRTYLPIEVPEVIDCLREHDVMDEIHFYPSDIVAEILKGQICHWEFDGRIVPTCVDIFFAASLDIPWQRLVVCKELCHLLDDPRKRVSSQDEFERLVSRIALPLELQNLKEDDAAASSDRFGLYQALSILFPFACRELLLPAYKDGTLTIQDIARMTALPPSMVGLVMSDVWVHVYAAVAP